MEAARTRRMIAAAAALAAGLAPLGATAAGAQTPTRLLVRAVAHDAKVIGSGVGGARITVRDAATGEVLASGVQEGSTGDTERIMGPSERQAAIFGAGGAAAFVATLQLERPTRVEVEAEGPLGTQHAVQRATKTLLLVPGHDVVGEGLILELNGYTVAIERPAGAEIGGDVLPVRATVTMLCGCPTSPGGLWDSERIEVTARLVRAGEVLDEVPLRYAGRSSTYEGSLRAPEGGEAELQVIAVQAARAETGMATRELRFGP